MREFLLILLSFNIVTAQVNTDYVNALIVPSIVLFVFLYGILSFVKIPQIFSIIVSLALISFAYISGLINIFSSYTLSLGSLASTGIYIGIFLLGAMLASKKGIKGKKIMRYTDVRSMNRKQISQEMSNIEKRLVELQTRLEKVKIQEHNLELQFANSKNPQFSKELERIRKIKNELSDALDMLIERREHYKRVYREASV
ncbi:MAG: hypothetical protein QXJ06_02940 [Candidatus Aenigmatarchaeota archaeon]